MTAPDESRRIAAEYVLGTLDAGERKTLHALIADDARFAGLVRMWEMRFAPLHELSASAVPPDTLWDEILARLPPEAEPESIPDEAQGAGDVAPAIPPVEVGALSSPDVALTVEFISVEPPFVAPHVSEPLGDAAAGDGAAVTGDAGKGASGFPPGIIAPEAAVSEFVSTEIGPIAAAASTIEERDAFASTLDRGGPENAAADLGSPPVAPNEAAPAIEDGVGAPAGTDPAALAGASEIEADVPQVVEPDAALPDTTPIPPVSAETTGAGESPAEVSEPDVAPAEPAFGVVPAPSRPPPSEPVLYELAPSEPDTPGLDPPDAPLPDAEKLPVSVPVAVPPPQVEVDSAKNPWRVASGLLMLALLLVAVTVAYRETRRPPTADFFAVLHPQPMAGVALTLEPGNGTVSVLHVPEAAPEGMRYHLWVSSPALGTRRLCVFQRAGLIQSRELASLGRAALNEANLLLTLEPESADPSAPSGDTVYSGKAVPR